MKGCREKGKWGWGDGSGTYDGHGGRVVAAAGLDADVAVLNDVDAADAVELADGVERDEELEAVGDGLALGGQLDGQAALEVQLDVLWGGGGGHGVVGAAKVSSASP